MPRIAKCTEEDPRQVFYIDWVPYVLQLCLGATCCGVPFGKVRHHPINTRRQLSIMRSMKARLDWALYSLPAPYDFNVGTEETCLLVLSLFAAFPELTSVAAFFHGGKDWNGVKHAVSEIGIGNCHDGAGSVYCLTLDGQITLRGNLLQHTQHVFTTDVTSCVTYGMHVAARAAAVAGDA
jgi:hypothetical protein